jgi:hypothetical protein
LGILGCSLVLPRASLLLLCAEVLTHTHCLLSLDAPLWYLVVSLLCTLCVPLTDSMVGIGFLECPLGSVFFVPSGVLVCSLVFPGCPWVLPGVPWGSFGPPLVVLWFLLAPLIIVIQSPGCPLVSPRGPLHRSASVLHSFTVLGWWSQPN